MGGDVGNKDRKDSRKCREDKENQKAS